ncbi:ParB N-terminal domain-containing protein [Tumidithrix elongata RA019]|uniref:ParB N-terminal domain-containing protein n=1 Tax=Tumidithrix elongata BACA0141 TaxID=2716417 RepID=A0AAW9PUN1_9CYAN|nr:ParB N-terminal domain-containing protein [Tumidithrix elongata RA019]
MSLLSDSIDIHEISTIEPRSHFSEQLIDQLATSILESNGIINPLILRKKTPMSYEVVEGHLEYYAAVKANQLDSDFEAIRAFVVKPQNESAICEQVKLLRAPIALLTPSKTELHENVPPGNSNNSAINLQKLEEQVQGIQQKLNDDFFTLNQKIDSLFDLISSLIASNSNKIPSEPQKTGTSTTKTKKSSTKKESSSAKSENLNQPSPREIAILNEMNTLSVRELALKLDRVGIKESIRTNIFAARDQHLFDSLIDLQKRVKGIAEKTLEKIIDKWA